jgi:hypothetical protein
MNFARSFYSSPRRRARRSASITPAGWTGCRMIVVSPLLRELVRALDAPAGQPLPAAREQHLTALVMDEIAHASTQALGVPMPHPQTGDKRLRCAMTVRNGKIAV